MSTVKNWLDANPDQVVTLLLTNGDNLPVSNFGDAMKNTGLSNYAFNPGMDLTMDQWPTLQQLIDRGSRLVMFLGTTFGYSSICYANHTIFKIMVPIPLWSHTF